MTAQFFFRKEKEGRKREKLTLGSSEFGPDPGKSADWKQPEALSAWDFRATTPLAGGQNDTMSSRPTTTASDKH